LRTEAIDDDEAGDLAESLGDIRSDLKKAGFEDRQKFFGVKGSPDNPNVIAEVETLTQGLAETLGNIGIQALNIALENKVLGDRQQAVFENIADLLDSRVGDVAGWIGTGMTLYDIYDVTTIENKGYGVACKMNECLLLTPKGSVPLDPL
jgi:hypothetical protein